MKQHRDFYITIEDLDAFICKVIETLPAEWKRNFELEGKLPDIPSEKMYCFKRSKNDGLDANLWLAVRGDNQLYISNIVPTELSELKIDDYNRVLLEFVNSNLQSLIKGMGGVFELTTDTYVLEGRINTESLRCLRVFSSAANKSTGSTHSRDKKRWFDFIVAYHKSGAYLGSQDLDSFLIDDGWSEDMADTLVSQFEYSLHLLNHYEGK